MGATTVATTKVGRNDPCPCGSGKKFKHCCLGKDARADVFYTAVADAAVAAPSRAAERRKLKALSQVAQSHWHAERYPEAVVAYTEIARLEPNSADAQFDLGLALSRCGGLAEAAARFERAIELRPGFVVALNQLAYVLEMGGNEFQALPVYRRLGRTADDPAVRLYYSAKALAMEGHLDEAEETYRRLLTLSPDLAAAREVYGQLLLDQGKFKDAEAEFLRAVEVHPGAFEKLTQVRRMTEADRSMIDRMRAIADGSGLDLEPRIAIHFGLGKAFNDLGDYAEAMRHYDAANGLRANTARLDRRAHVEEYDRMITRFSREKLDCVARSLARPPLPDDDLPVFIVGMPRSGTTLTEQILSAHPQVAAAGEQPFWKSKLLAWARGPSTPPEAPEIAEAAADYAALLRRFGPRAVRVTDKAPRNFELLWLVRIAFPNARIIHCRRNPVDTGLSIYFSYFWAHQNYAFDRGDIAFFYRQYERLMEHWRSVLPPDRFTEVKYEALVESHEAETRRLIAFLGLEWDDACLAPEENQRAVKTASVWQARQPVYKTSVERWRRYEPWLGELRALLPAEEPAALGSES